MSTDKKIVMNTATIGHVDHGKTTLTSAITIAFFKKYGNRWGVKSYAQIDNSQEERVRGITINATTVRFESPKYIYNHTDCPGHEQFRSHMITGTGSTLDLPILLVAANDSVTPSTIEFIKICTERGFKKFGVFINKIDLYDRSERQMYIDLALAEVEHVFSLVGAEMIAWTATSARDAASEEDTPEAIEAREQIIKFFSDIEAVFPEPVRETDKPFLAQVENIFNIPGRGVVVATAVQKGKISVGQSLEVLHVKSYAAGRPNLVAVVTSIEAFKTQQESAEAGDNVGLLLRGLKAEDVESGDVLCAPNSFKMKKVIKIDMHICTKEEGGRKTSIKSGFRPVFFIGAGKYTGTLYITKVSDQSGVITYESVNEMEQVQKGEPDTKAIAHPGAKAEGIIVFDHFVPVVAKKLQIMEGAERVASALIMQEIE